MTPKMPGDSDAGAGVVESGSNQYAALCAGCHGPTARGGIGPPILPWTRGAEALISSIVTTMPPDDPTKCADGCARDIAAFLLSLPPEELPLSCERFPPARRQLRLLTRREYANTVRDVFGAVGKACADDTSCAPNESCQNATCVADACNLRSFVWKANGRRPNSVHVAGSFNNWPATVSSGGWALALNPQTDTYTTKRQVPNGSYQYKFVVDGQWLLDDSNPNQAPDGFGGSNSVLSVQCDTQGSTDTLDLLTASFPIETRPKGYAFDNNAEAGLVTSGHIEAYLQTGELIANRVTAPCRPSGTDRRPCTEQFLRSVGRRLFRRSLTAEEVERYVNVVNGATDFDAGIRQMTQWLLSSPHFLYRSELGTAAADGTYRLTPLEVASALSYSLWSSTPDDALLDAAEQGRLSATADIVREGRRLLESPKARATIRGFATQWLGVERLATIDKAPGLFPSFTPSLRASMRAETPAFFEHVVFSGTGSFEELLTAGYSFVDEPLSKLYEMNPVSTLSRQTLPTSRAAGLLGHAGVLASYAHSDQTSPVKRGVFVREHLLCQEFPPPPANAGGVPRIDPNATTRERFAQHMADPSCKSCHQFIDAVGFGFEGFDAIGARRTTEAGRAIDTAGELRDVERFGAGTSVSFTTLPQLGQALAQSRRAKACFATHVFRFTRGRLETPAERCTVEALTNRFVAANGDIREVLIDALADDRFTSRLNEETP
jgi:hypothetical protein